jgi:hypothetical protein
MGLSLLTENYGDIVKKLFGLSDESAASVKNVADQTDEFSSAIKQVVGGTGSYDDLLGYVGRKYSKTTPSVDDIVAFIKTQPDMLKKMALSSDAVMKKAAEDLFAKSSVKSLFTPQSWDYVDDLIKMELEPDFIDSSIRYLDDALTNLKPYKGRGNVELDDLIKQLEERKVLADKLKTDLITPKTTTSNFTPSSIASDFLQNFAYSNKSFIQMRNGSPMSGWKIHIYGEGVDDSAYLITKLDDFMKENNAAYKIATDSFYKGSEGTIQKGKAMTIYIPYDIVKNNKQKEFFDGISSKISDYTKSGSISGDKSYDGKLHYRYEYNQPFDALPEGGVAISDASKYYVSNEGDYLSGTGNLQPDLFDRVSTDVKQVSSNVTTSKNLLSGNRISNRSFSDSEINWDKISNATNLNDYNKLIANAINTGDYSYISRGGFEKYGIDNFRDYLMNNIEMVNDLDAPTGRWSVNFK